MEASFQKQERSVLLTFRFLGTAILGSVIIALVCTFGALSDQIAVLGAYVSILGGLFISYLEQERQRDNKQKLLLKNLAIPLEIARDSAVFREYEEIVQGIAATLKIDDPIFRELALAQLSTVGQEITTLSQGRIEYQETETWRTAYEKVLRSEGVTLYRSVALVSSLQYWQDEPGKRSIALNYELQDKHGLNIERIAILSELVWPEGKVLPLSPILEWLEDQHNNGIWIELVRKKDIAQEPSLISDLGIYGEKAVGKQELDESSRTSQFLLSFHQDDIQNALHQWEKLRLYTISFRKLLDQP